MQVQFQSPIFSKEVQKMKDLPKIWANLKTHFNILNEETKTSLLELVNILEEHKNLNYDQLTRNTLKKAEKT